MPPPTMTPDPAIPNLIELHHGVYIAPERLTFKTARASGPGGQNVNKRNTKVELRVLVDELPLDYAARARLRRRAAGRINDAGELVITSSEERSQLQNKNACLERLREVVLDALNPPKPRRATKPSKGSKVRRVDAKVRRGGVKRLRQRRPEED